MDKCFNDARAAVAAIFCCQVLNMPLELMGDHEKKCTLENLGIDADALSHQEYREELIQDRIKRFCSLNEDLNKHFDNMMEDAQLERETVEERA